MKRKASSFLSDGSDADALRHHLEELIETSTELGPKDCEELYLWPEQFSRRLRSVLPSAVVDNALATIQGVRVTTHFSGVGTPELALRMLELSLQKCGVWPSGRQVSFHSACDSDRRCQQVLQAHDIHSRPLHLFTDVLQAVPEEVVHALQTKLRSLQEAFQSCRAARPEERNNKRVELEKEMRTYAMDLLGQASFKTDMQCLIHGASCAHFPAKGGIHVEVAGSPCVPFVKGGAYGTSMSWLHDVTVPFYVWIHAVKRASPALVVHECVPGFDVQHLEHALNHPVPCYVVQSLVWSPEDEGIPVRRERRYTLCIRMDLAPPLLRFDDLTWRALAYAGQAATAELFLRASAEAMTQLKSLYARRRGFPDVRTRSNGTQGEWSWEALLTSNERSLVLQMRAEAMRFIADEASRMALYAVDDSRRVEYGEQVAGRHSWLVNLSQSFSFQPRTSGKRIRVMPALLRSAKLFVDRENRRESRAVHPLELFATQSLPVLLPPEHPLTVELNFEKVLEGAGLQLWHLPQLAGNGMHLCSVGKVLLFALATTQFHC